MAKSLNVVSELSTAAGYYRPGWYAAAPATWGNPSGWVVTRRFDELQTQQEEQTKIEDIFHEVIYG